MLTDRGGKCLVKAIRDYGQADIKVNEVSIRIEICWSRIAAQLEVTRHLDESMSQEQRNLQYRTLKVLDSKLGAAILALSKLDKHKSFGAAKRFHFLGLRDTFETTITELESWQKLFEPTWFQLIKAAPSTIDETLKSIAVDPSRASAEPTRDALGFRRAFSTGGPAFIAEKTLDEYEMSEIPYCTAQIAADNKEKKYHVIDTVSTEAVKLKDARDLAYRLRDSNPATFGIMKCKGIVRFTQSSSLGFVFRVPDGFEAIRSLRQLLLFGPAPESLTNRLEVARQLVVAVYYVHLYEFVHKNICPETILSLAKSQDQSDRPTVCLVGFQVLRHADGKTNTARLGDKNRLYQHPLRQETERPDYVMQHDIYSLGVCLLEIGLWDSLMESSSQGTTLAINGAKLGKETDISNPYAVKEQLVTLSRGVLRTTMGDKYSKVVETCLTCLDPDNTDFGDPREFQDEDGVEVGGWYVKKVMDIISTISI